MQEAVHPTLELATVAVRAQMGHLVDKHVFKESGIEPRQFQIQADAAGVRGARAPAGGHDPERDGRRTIPDDGYPLFEQSGQSTIDSRPGLRLAWFGPVVEPTSKLIARLHRFTIAGHIHAHSVNDPFLGLADPCAAQMDEPFDPATLHPEGSADLHTAVWWLDAQVHVADRFARDVNRDPVNGPRLGGGDAPGISHGLMASHAVILVPPMDQAIEPFDGLGTWKARLKLTLHRGATSLFDCCAIPFAYVLGP